MANLDENAVRELLQPVDQLIADLKKTVEKYNVDEMNPQVRADNEALLRRADQSSDLLREIVFQISARALEPG